MSQSTIDYLISMCNTINHDAVMYIMYSLAHSTYLFIMCHHSELYFNFFNLRAYYHFVVVYRCVATFTVVKCLSSVVMKIWFKFLITLSD